jgi:uncharacterized protein (DUF2236 family)
MAPEHLSLLRRVAGDWRSVLDGSAIGILQLMYPPLGTAVASESGFFEDPSARVFRSIPQIWATILAPDGEARARRIRDLHRDIKGVASGRRFHALDPETFWWAHATFTHLMFRSVEHYHRDGTLDDAGRERLYADTVAWYERYGVSMRPVPPDYAAFRKAFERFCAERLEMTDAARRSLDIAAMQEPHLVIGVPAPVVRVAGPRLVPWGRAATVGKFPPVVRDRLGLEWTEADQRRLDRATAAVRTAFEVIPTSVNRRTFEHWLRRTGARTRAQRYAPAGAA